MTGNLKLLGAQSMAICDNEAVEVGKVYFGINRRQGYDYKCTQILANQALELHAGDINKPADTNQFGACYARGEAMIGWGYDKTTGRRWATLGASDDSSPLLAGVTVDTGSSPEVSATGCTKVIDFAVAPGMSKASGYANNIIFNAIGNLCFLQFTIIGEMPLRADTHVCTIPAGYRPSGNVIFNTAVNSDGFGQCRIQPDGKVIVWANTRMGYTGGCCMYYAI